MKRMGKKLASRRGETVAETLLAVLVGGVAVGLLTVSVNVGNSLNGKAMIADRALYTELAEAEARTHKAKTVNLTITLDNQKFTFPVDIYGEDGKLQAYGRSGT